MYTIRRNILKIAPMLSVGVLLALYSISSKAQSSLSLNQDNFSGEFMDGNINQVPTKDSTVIEREIPKEYSQWRIDKNSGLNLEAKIDSFQKNFQNIHLTEGVNKSFNYLGNMGSPRLSRIYFDREDFNSFIFDAPYDFFIKNPWDFKYTDTKTPHINLTYFKAGDKRRGEERIKGYFAANFNKKVGIGIDMDYSVGRGKYTNQSTSLFDSRLYGYYRGDLYSVTANINRDEIKIAENGGVEDDRYITNPEAMAEGKKEYSPEDIPVLLNDTWNNIKRKQFMVTQVLNFKTDIEVSDSILDTVFVYREQKVAGILSHSTEIGGLQRRYIAYNTPANYYQYNYLIDDSLDITKNFYVNNTLSISILEGVSKWAIVDFTAYMRYLFNQYSQPDTLISGRDSEYIKVEKETDFVIGGMVNRSIGDIGDISAQVETVIAGYNFGNFSIGGKGLIQFPFLKEKATLTTNLIVKNEKPVYYFRNFHSQHLWWDNSLNNELSTRINCHLNIDRWRISLSAGMENIYNYTYFANTGNAVTIDNQIVIPNNISVFQKSASLGVLNITLNKHFIFGPLNWENSITYQTSSDQNALPLPDYNIYSNLFLKFNYTKILRLEIGGDITYFNKYYAPNYLPALGQYHIQNLTNREKIGGYPFINLYVNCSLRGVRFYVMGYHINESLMGNRNCFMVPHYPINPRLLKIGISWTFFD